LSALDNNRVPLNKKDFRLDKQLERAALTLEPQWTAKGIILEADLRKCSLCANEDSLLQVWMNLLHNAIKFTPAGGRIDITLAFDNGLAVVKISDTGTGIAPEDQIHIFERFYKVDKARDRSLGGNGLGLSLVKTIVEMHGGSVSVESDIGNGTAFQVSLPGLHSV
jgi:signal transduction histidine kinase